MLKEVQKSQFKNPLGNQKGMAIFETIPVLFAFVVFFGFSIGFFGVIHTGILNSIAARNYAFDTFRHRTNLIYFRENPDSLNNFYSQNPQRYHATIAEIRTDENRFYATQRTINYGIVSKRAGLDENYHNEKLMEVETGRRYTKDNLGANPVWLRTMYGMCVTAQCGD